VNGGLLTILVFLPAAAALALSLASRLLSPAVVKVVGLAASGLTLILAATLALGFTPGGGFQFVDAAEWIPSLGVSWKVGVDGISLLMVLLTSVLVPLALLTAWSGSTRGEKGLTILMLFMETAMLGVFVSMDLLLFYFFWEASLIPMYFIIGIWGGSRRVYATMKFFLFTFAGSVLMLAAIITVAVLQWKRSGVLTFDTGILALSRPAIEAQRWLLWAFLAAFLVKLPAVPLHTWLPDAHVEAPTAGSIILAGVLLKMGGYGLVRFCPVLFPAAALESRYILCALGVAGILYGGVMVMVQKDLKRLVAYSSVSHMGYVLAGLASLTVAGMTGAVLQMASHGLAIGALFAIVGLLYERTHSRDLASYGGLSRVLPHFAWAFLAVTLCSMGFPGTSGFVSEFLVLLGLWKYSPELAVFTAGGVVLSAVYMLTMYRAVMLGPVSRKELASLRPLNAREAFVLACFVFGILAIGVWPAPWIEMVRGDVLGILGGLGTAVQP